MGLPEHFTIDALVSCSWLVDAPDSYTSDTRRCKNIPSICCIACSYVLGYFFSVNLIVYAHKQWIQQQHKLMYKVYPDYKLKTG